MLGLVVRERDGLDHLVNLIKRSGSQVCRLREACKNCRGVDVYSLVRALRRKDYGNKQMKRSVVVKLRFSSFHILGKPVCNMVE